MTEIIECLSPDEECPSGYYPDTNPREPLHFLKYYKVIMEPYIDFVIMLPYCHYHYFIIIIHYY